jgi:threonine dehydratase
MQSPDGQRRLSLERIEAAAGAIDAVFLDTPQFEPEPLSAPLGARVVLKVETLNPIRSFKGRGASHYTARVAPGAEVICASAGNFGQAMAYAGRARHSPAARARGAGRRAVRRGGRGGDPRGS